MAEKSERILFFSRDPGGANQLMGLKTILEGCPTSPARDHLFAELGLSSSPDIILIAKDYARQIWQKHGLVVRDGQAVTSEEAIRGMLIAHAPDQIITGTSHVDDRSEQRLWQVAGKLGIKTTAFLDSGANIALRFTTDQGVITLPDRVSVIEELAKMDVVNLGVPSQGIFVSGDLYHHHVTANLLNIRNTSLRSEWKAEAGEAVILFASDYVQEMQALGIKFDVTEFESLDFLVGHLTGSGRTGHIKEMLVVNGAGPFRVVIRPHPKDVPDKYAAYADRKYDNVEILISAAGTAAEAILSADVVASMGSSLLSEARTLGVPDLELGTIIPQCRNLQKTVS